MTDDDPPRFGIRWWPADHPDRFFITPCYDETEARHYLNTAPERGWFTGPLCRVIVKHGPNGWEDIS